MPSEQLTRGGLKPATLKNLSTNTIVNFMFNPNEYKISKSNTWKDRPVSGLNLPLVNFQQGGAKTLSLTLHFDTLAAGTDVTTLSAPLWEMAMIDTTKEDPKSKKSQPPSVEFAWGKLRFKAIVTDISETFTLFSDKGTPLRSKVEISLRQFIDPADVPPQRGSGTSGSGDQKTVTKIEGQRMDNMAASSTGSASNYRDVAEKNNVDNPMKVKNGKKLKA